MVLRAVVLGSLLVATPVLAEPMNADAARRFVAGKLFSFNCFEGSTGSGRIFNDGSVAGVVRMGGNGNTRFMHLPPGTLFPKDDRICSHVRGAFFNPCFELTKTSDKSFRGAISGFGFASCEFVRRGGGRETLQASIAPAAETTASVTRASIRRGHKTQHEKPAAAPTQPVTSAPLPSVEQAGIRSSITP
ncbi:MAG: hypothetical protein E6G97_26270 [Alphaproteobacteria bacterium]|nr:MAG: hypothetical protein E6G97_26270 [Alphaproteobacteria bacterium]